MIKCIDEVNRSFLMCHKIIKIDFLFFVQASKSSSFFLFFYTYLMVTTFFIIYVISWIHPWLYIIIISCSLYLKRDQHIFKGIFLNNSYSIISFIYNCYFTWIFFKKMTSAYNMDVFMYYFLLSVNLSCTFFL